MEPSQLDALVRRANIGGGDPVALLVIDIDHFKKINDSFGHQVGDEVLREFAVRLASNVRAIDLPVRFGGEEFVVVMPETQLCDAERIAERIRMHVAGSPFRVMDGEELLTVTISIGVAASLGEGDGPDTILKRAGRGACTKPRAPAATGWSRGPPETKNARTETGRFPAKSEGCAKAYLILPSLNSTCLRTTGSYFFITNFSVLVRGFFLVT